MKTTFRHLPPLNTLVFFEAAARHRSFTKAADELFITQSAVSKQIRILEESLGFELFRREARQLLLTDAGKELHSDVNAMLQQLTESISRIRSWAEGQSVTISCTQAVSHYWLFPRIARFNTQHPDITVNIYATNEITEMSCLRFDLGILNGDNNWRVPLHSHMLFEERIYPVSRYDYPIDKLLMPEELLQQRLIHLDPSAWRWPTWIDWFAHFGIAYTIPKNAQLFNQVTLALDATVQGMGIGLGWEFMTHALLANKDIKRVSEFYYAPGKSDYLVYGKSRSLSPSAMVFRDWLLADLQAEHANTHG
ncbi:LysR substrate-binding domain-containing protein [Pseudogulbenkiania sp. NH8B]|uniref:LysR substrate-binding domain-containing protein n=1 Tax=Pseudogulbenkiania sp. (strain NH8B) TaxID=748280 RepID=UPI00030ED007|nr:LysR substrate-binding domain-containing protein [Pseudogulbenkiania sp. NH8B]